ncbi:MAG TPA: hypothetical protein VM557_12535 [Thermoanaerobaculia bacterium]|nr:hypothetical protein [Thermoanaerobaculia bacterium]
MDEPDAFIIESERTERAPGWRPTGWEEVVFTIGEAPVHEELRAGGPSAGSNEADLDPEAASPP